MTWAKVGMACQCISDFWDSRGGGGPSKGGRYTIVGVYLNPANLVTLHFAECYGWLDENSGKVFGWSVKNFRPIVSQEDDIAVFKSIADQVPNMEMQDD